MRKGFDTDIMCTVKDQRNMDMVDQELQYKELFGIGENKVGVTGWITHYKIFSQPGRTGITAFGSLSAYVRAEKDKSGLGRVV